MVGDLLARRRHRDQLLVPHQAVQQLRVVHDGVVGAELRVLATDGVEAVRAGDDDLALVGVDALEQLVDGLDVLRGELLEQELVAGAAGRVTGTGLAGAQHQELHARGGEQFGDGLGGLLGAVLVGAGAADPEQVLEAVEALDVLAVDRDVEVQLVDPGGAFLGVLAPGVALEFQVLEQHAELAGELGLDHDLVAAHVDDVVDVLDVHRALLDAGATVGAGPQHVGVDDAALLSGADQRAQRLLGAGALDAGEAVLGDAVSVQAVAQRGEVDRTLFGHRLALDDVRRLGEQVVAQVHHDELGGQRLTGVPGGALRLATTALGAGRHVEVGLPGEVLDLAAAEHRVLGRIVEVDRLALVLHRQQRAEAVGQSLEGDVDGGQTDVQVLGVQHDQQEDQHDADVRQQRDGLDPDVGGVAQRGQQGGHAVGEERAVLVREVLAENVDGGTAEHRVGRDDQEDHDEDLPRATVVRSVEPGLAADVVGVLGQTDDREDDDAGQHGQGEEVLQEAQDGPVPDEWDGELRIEQDAIGFQVDRCQDEEAPHGEEVRNAGDRPLEELRLREDFLVLVQEAADQIVLAPTFVAELLPGADQLGQPQDALGGEPQDDDRCQQPDDQSGHVERVFEILHRASPSYVATGW
ncbi:Uncharacterised protein [Mycobacteroides abscessus subsp. abscessus]|nr:Uncharacterised protein [Mycobacteroides abscessus subsp. abscessus]